MHPGSNRRILVVDDEPDIRDSLEGLLAASLRDTDVMTADSGKRALEMLRSETVDLIVSDYKMPGMNGLEFLDEARSVAPNARRILMTAFARELAAEMGKTAGVEMVFTKPIEPRGLVMACQRILDSGPA